MASSSEQPGDGDSTADIRRQCVDLLNESALLANVGQKLDNLCRVQELLVHRRPQLLAEFVDALMAFQSDASADVRRCVLAFAEQACRSDGRLLVPVVSSVALLLHDTASVPVLKRAVQAVGAVYRAVLQWLCGATTTTGGGGGAATHSLSEPVTAAWHSLCRLKQEVFTYVDHDNDGVRTLAVKFMEAVVLMQTYSEWNGVQRDGDFCLDQVPSTLRVARPRRLEEEARAVFAQLVAFHGSAHVSSVNLMACMSSLTQIARRRPSLAARPVVEAIESLLANLPPTLAQSQLHSVRKQAHTQLLSLLRQPAVAASSHCRPVVCRLLCELGASQSVIERAMPSNDTLAKYEQQQQQQRSGRQEQLGSGDVAMAPLKRFNDNVQSDDEEGVGAGGGSREAPAAKRPSLAARTDWQPVSSTPFSAPVAVSSGSAQQLTESWVMERLSASVAASLVLASMPRLPDTAPARFSRLYRPMATSGGGGDTQTHMQLVARLLAEQLARAGLGPSGGDGPASSASQQQPPPPSLNTAAHVPAPASQQRRHMVRALKLSEIARPLSSELSDRLLDSALSRFLEAGALAARNGLAAAHTKLLTAMAANFGQCLIEKLLAHVLHNIGERAELCVAWLFEEYASAAGFSNMALVLHTKSNYEQVLCMLASALTCRPDLSEGHQLLQRLYLQTPSVPPSAVNILQSYAGELATHRRGHQLLRLLALRRPPVQRLVAAALLQLCDSVHEPVQAAATELLLELHSLPVGQPAVLCIEQHAVDRLCHLTAAEPPAALLSWLQQRGGPPPPPPSETATTATAADAATGESQWTDQLITACVSLYLALLPRAQQLLPHLATVYVRAAAAVKCVILRAVQQPLRQFSMQSPPLLALVEQCPAGAETLVTRLLHVLTESRPPSRQLVTSVRSLYEQRVSDVRLLIPVLAGLERDEVTAALPQLIQLNPLVVKEVFHRLLAVNTPTGATNGDSAAAAADTSSSGDGDRSETTGSCWTPEDLLVALHNVPADACDMRTVIRATGLCFAERHVYTQEVLAVVLQRLMDQPTLPTLLMRTVIQSLALYHRLIGLVLNILQRLIGRQVWQQPRVWQGFIKCCQRTVPNSCQVLLQLPGQQLQHVLAAAPELRAALLDYVAALSESQRSHIPDTVMTIVSQTVQVKTEDSTPIDVPAADKECVGFRSSIVKQEPLDPDETAMAT